MKALRLIAEVLIYLQAIILSGMGMVWLFDKAFDQVLTSLRVKKAFRAYMVDYWFKRFKERAREKEEGVNHDYVR
jgi:hypothetical protein